MEFKSPEQPKAGFTVFLDLYVVSEHGSDQLHSPVSFVSLASGGPGATSPRDTLRTKPLACKTQGPGTGLWQADICFWTRVCHPVRESCGMRGCREWPGLSPALTL